MPLQQELRLSLWSQKIFIAPTSLWENDFPQTDAFELWKAQLVYVWDSATAQKSQLSQTLATWRSALRAKNSISSVNYNYYTLISHLLKMCRNKEEDSGWIKFSTCAAMKSFVMLKPHFMSSQTGFIYSFKCEELEIRFNMLFIVI